MEAYTQDEIEEALRWIGFPVDSEVDICENGEVWIGLTQILPKKPIKRHE